MGRTSEVVPLMAADGHDADLLTWLPRFPGTFAALGRCNGGSTCFLVLARDVDGCRWMSMDDGQFQGKGVQAQHSWKDIPVPCTHSTNAKTSCRVYGSPFSGAMIAQKLVGGV